MWGTKISQNSFDPKFKMAAMPKYGKNPSKNLLLQNHQADNADILQEAYGAPPHIK